MRWFKHLTDAHDSNDLTKIRMKFGAEGYAVYWYCLELIAGDLGEKGDITFELKHDAEVIAFNLKMDTLRVEEIMRHMLQLGLFESDRENITCFKIAKYLSANATQNQQIKSIIRKYQEQNGDRAGYIYLMLASKKGAQDEVKIGRSINPWARLPEIQRARAEEGMSIEILGTHRTTDCITLEASLHSALSPLNIENEWFRREGKLETLIKTITCSKSISDYELLRSVNVDDVAQLRLQPEEKRREEKREEKKEDIGQTRTPDRFHDFWLAYPKKVKKKDALKAWKSKRLDTRAGEIIADVENRKINDGRWLDGFIPDPTTYLRGERWADELTPKNKRGSSPSSDMLRGAQ